MQKKILRRRLVFHIQWFECQTKPSTGGRSKTWKEEEKACYKEELKGTISHPDKFQWTRL